LNPGVEIGLSFLYLKEVSRTYPFFLPRTDMAYIERKVELKRRRKRRESLAKLQTKLAATKTPADQQAILAKIKRISPFWQPPGK